VVGAALVAPQELAAHRRRQGQGNDAGNRDRRRQRHREFTEETAEITAHEEQRNEGGYQRNGDRDDGEADLPRPLERGGDGRLTGLHVAHDVLDHDDGVVDDEADGDGQRHQRQVVERVVERVHRRASAGDGDRDGDAGDQRRPEAAQEEQHHHDDQRYGDGQRVFDVGDRRADRAGAVGEHGDLDRRRQPFRQFRGGGADAVGGLDDIGAGLAIDIDDDGALLVEAAGDAHVGGGVDDLGDVAEPHRGAVAIGDDESAIGIGAEELVVGADRVGSPLALQAALGIGRVALGDGDADVLEAEAE